MHEGLMSLPPLTASSNVPLARVKYVQLIFSGNIRFVDMLRHNYFTFIVVWAVSAKLFAEVKCLGITFNVPYSYIDCFL